MKRSGLVNIITGIRRCGKAAVDESHERGAFRQSGSRRKSVFESLAGRVGVLQLQGFSLNKVQE